MTFSSLLRTETSQAEAKMRVLIVDDTPDNVWFLAEALNEVAIIKVARCGVSALASVHAMPQPEIILLDVQMPGMDGYEVCRRLKETPLTSEIPIIFVTAMSDSREEVKGLRYGAADYILKPFDPAIVRARVKTLVDFKRLRDSLNDTIRNQVRVLRRTQVGTIMALADLAEWRDPETGEHLKRTQEYVRCIAEALARKPSHARTLTPEYIEMLHMCAPLHDMGKVSISDAILLKPGSLSTNEFSMMQKHCEFGADILLRSLERIGRDPFLELAYEVTRWHHERWDGLGYPDKLAGEAISLPARIMSVADVYDALISARPYKVAFSHEKSMQILIADRGKRFDPDVLDAFLSVEKEICEIAMHNKETRQAD